MKLKNISLINVAVYLTIFGYWYNLPVISTTIFGGYNEFRLYDLTFAILIVKLLTSGCYHEVLKSIKLNRAMKYLLRFSQWSSIMVVPTIIYALITSNFIYVGMTIIFIYHLWGFLLFVAFVNTYYGGERLEKLLRWFLILSTAHLFLYYAQITGIVGHLWNERYIESYGEMAYSGTLGPNRVTPGMMTLLGSVISIFTLYRMPALKYTQALAIVNLILAIPAIVMIGSRTTFVTLVIFLLIYLIFYKKTLIPLSFIIVPALISIYSLILNPEQKERIKSNVEYNRDKLTRGKEIDDLTIVEGYYNIGDGRWEILTRYVPFLLDNPQIIPFGSGFNNRMYAYSTKAASPHNVYLSLINEVGLVGLFLYVSWLVSYLGFVRKYRKENYRHEGLGIMVSLSVAMLISLLAGEHLYVYRPCFAIMGTFLFVMTAISIIVEEDYSAETQNV